MGKMVLKNLLATTILSNGKLIELVADKKDFEKSVRDVDLKRPLPAIKMVAVLSKPCILPKS